MQLSMDETSEKYYKFSTKWITELFIKNIIQKIKKNPHNLILDLGCGTGDLTAKIVKSMNTSVVCCDTNINRIKYAKFGFHLEAIIADIYYLPFKPSIFDMVLAIEIIEHLPNIEFAILEIKRIAKKDIIITVPNDPFFMLANFLRGKNLRTYGNPLDHINHFNKKSFESVLSKYFTSIEISTNAFLWLMAKTEK